MDKTLFGKKAKIDFDTLDLSSAGGLVLFQVQDTSFLDKIAAAIPEWRYKPLIQHPIQELVRQRVGQIMCGHEDANDCDAMRHDSALKMLAGRRPSGNDLGFDPAHHSGPAILHGLLLGRSDRVLYRDKIFFFLFFFVLKTKRRALKTKISLLPKVKILR